MKILVTGGAGYKGVVLVQRLLDQGHAVVIADNFMYGYQSVLHLVGNPNLEIKQLDIRNLQRADVSQFDVIYHLAGISGMPACAANPHAAEMINVEATRRLCTLLSSQQLIINASTTSFYGALGKECTESVDVQPVSIYGITKYQAEKLVQQRENSISLRFATVFGVSARMRVDLLVNDFTYKAVKERAVVLFDSGSRRTFLHIQDAISAYLFALDHQSEMRGQVFNVGSPALNYSKLEIAQAISKCVKYEIINSALPDLDRRDFLVSFDRLWALGYKTERTLGNGVCDLTKLYQFYSPNHSSSIV